MWDFIVPNSLWKLEGLCTQIGQPDLWYSSEKREQRQAVEICYKCPVIQKCRDEAFSNNEIYGIWGGMTELQRKEMRKRGYTK